MVARFAWTMLLKAMVVAAAVVAIPPAHRSTDPFKNQTASSHPRWKDAVLFETGSIAAPEGEGTDEGRDAVAEAGEGAQDDGHG